MARVSRAGRPPTTTPKAAGNQDTDDGDVDDIVEAVEEAVEAIEDAAEDAVETILGWFGQ
jgi:hypothetical protein